MVARENETSASRSAWHQGTGTAAALATVVVRRATAKSDFVGQILRPVLHGGESADAQSMQARSVGATSSQLKHSFKDSLRMLCRSPLNGSASLGSPGMALAVLLRDCPQNNLDGGVHQAL